MTAGQLSRERLVRDRCELDPLPRDHNRRHQIEVVGGVEHHSLNITREAALRERTAQRADDSNRALQTRNPRCGDARLVRSCTGDLDLLRERAKSGAAVGHRASTEKIRGLDARRFFVDGVELLIAQPCLR